MNVNVFESDSDEEIRHRLNNFRRRKVFKERIGYFHILSETDFKKRFRLNKNSCRNILEMIRPEIESTNNINQRISVEVQLLLTLRFYASGTMLITVADFVGVSKTFACYIVKKVSYAIARLHVQFIHMPRNEEEIEETKLGFYRIARFPNVTGAINCTHVRIQSPGGDNSELYRNRKGYFSWNVQVIGNSRLKICDIVARWPGSTHDQTIFNASVVKVAFENQHFHNSFLLGDSGYGITEYLLTPLRNPQTQADHLYNESHIRSRNTIERLFGVLKRRFPVVSYGMRVKPELSKAVIVAVAVLHNFAIDERDEWVIDDEIENVDQLDIHAPNENNGNDGTRLNLINMHFANL